MKTSLRLSLYLIVVLIGIILSAMPATAGEKIQYLTIDTGRPLSQTECMAIAIYEEAELEKWPGKLAVADVVLIRWWNHYAPTICDVIAQPNQFPWFNRGKSYQIDIRALYMAADVLDGKYRNDPVTLYLLDCQVSYFHSLAENIPGADYRWFINSVREGILIPIADIGHQRFYSDSHVCEARRPVS